MIKLKKKLHDIVFEAETPSGKAFDLILMVFIFLSVLIVMLDSVASLNIRFGQLFYTLEIGLTVIFTVEYLLRLWVINDSKKYALSFFGIIDLASILPMFISFIFPGTQAFLVIRLLRVLRVFRVLKLVRFVKESSVLIEGLRESARKIFVFIFGVLVLVIMMGAIMYSIEGGLNGFSSIPKSIYWAIVTLTTVGYGDIAPQTVFGQFVASLIMLLGYGIIAVPAGIVTAEINALQNKEISHNTETCPNCAREGHDARAKFCNRCGSLLN